MAVVDLVAVPERQKIDGESTATVTLSRAADAGGQVVILSNDKNDMVRMPFTLTIPAGATKGTFVIKALGELGNGNYVTSNTLVIFEAKINGVGRAAGFVVEPSAHSN